jgi:hypothetical protein
MGPRLWRILRSRHGSREVACTGAQSNSRARGRPGGCQLVIRGARGFCRAGQDNLRGSVVGSDGRAWPCGDALASWTASLLDRHAVYRNLNCGGLLV